MRQFSKTQRRLAVGAFLLTAAPVALGSTAYACQRLATLHANPSSATAGTAVTIFGRNYSTSATATPVQIRLDGRSGPILTEIRPTGSTAEIRGSVTLPAGTAVGTHTLVATQFTEGGDMVSGAPGRASITVAAAARTAAEGSTPSPVAAPSSDTAGAAAAVTPEAAPAAAVSRDAATPAAAVSGSAPAASAAAPTAAAASAAAPADVATTGAATAAPAAAAPAAALATAAPDAATSAPAAATPTVTSSGGFLPAASSDSTSALPGLTLAVGLALVLLSLGAFVKSGRTVLGGRGFTPLAG